MSRPGKLDSIHFRKLESTAIMSSKRPWTGQSLTIHTWPSRSMIWALISPTFSFRRVAKSCSPLMMRSLASFTQVGHSESVTRGQPSCGLVFCHDFSMGLSDHLGVKAGLGLYLLKNWMLLNATPAVVQMAESTYFIKRWPFTLGILLSTSLQFRIGRRACRRRV